MRTAPGAGPAGQVRRGRAPPGPDPRVEADDTETAEHRALILRPHVPTRSGWPRARLPSSQRVALTAADLSADATTKLVVVVKVRIEAKPAEAVAAAFRYPREAHPRSPERVAAHKATASHSPAAMVAPPTTAVYYRHEQQRRC